MSRINPLTLGAFLLVLLLVLFVKLSGLKSELKEITQSYKASEVLAQDLAALKNIYKNKKKTKTALYRILSQGSLKATKIKKEETKNGVKLSASKMNSKALNSLMSKILNGSYRVSSLNIKRLNTTQVSFSMEIKW